VNIDGDVFSNSRKEKRGLFLNEFFMESHLMPMPIVAVLFST
jgi:hypothetical protein